MRRISLTESKDFVKLEKLTDEAVAFTSETREDGFDYITYYKEDVFYNRIISRRNRTTTKTNISYGRNGYL